MFQESLGCSESLRVSGFREFGFATSPPPKEHDGEVVLSLALV